MGAVIGIDLGTTNTVVAAVRDGRAEALPDESGSTLIPSIVSFLPSGAVLVGNTARERRAQDVRNTIYSVKRLIGRTWDSPEVSQTLSRFPFELREGPGRATFVIARGETYTLPEISAFVLRKAKSIAELELGEPIDRAVITVPANFNELQRAATKVAGRVAGLEILRIINEPTAAALAFGHSRGNATRLAVYDFGGGTFDFTLLRLTNDVFEVLATAGDTFLGGDDIDAEIIERMSDRFIAEGCADPREIPEGLERLRESAEQLKLRLSSEPDASVRLDELGIDGAPAVEFLLTRRDLDSISRPIVERTFAICRDALTAAKLNAKEMDDVLLVGGSTKDPYVRKRVAEFFGRPARFDVDPHEVVAIGAAQYALTLSERGEAALEIAVPKPPLPDLPLVQSSTEAGSDGADFRQKTQPFGKIAPTPAVNALGAGKGPIAPITAPPIAIPSGLSLDLPDTPTSKAAPSTQDLARRRTTGIGIGPATSVPETLPGPEQKQSPQEDLPATKAQPSREVRRGPMVRVTAGVPPSRSSAPDLTQTLASSGSLNAPTASSRRGPVTDRFGFSLNQPVDDASSPPSPPLATLADGAHPSTDDIDSWSDLPEPLSRPPSAQKGFDQRRFGRDRLPDAVSAPELPLVVPASQTFKEAPADDDSALPAMPGGDEDEPTVIRRSRPNLGDEQELPVARAPAKQAGRPASLNEEEIRARYGNLPLIVGGKRVGVNAPPAPPAELEWPASSSDLPAQAIGALSRQHTEFSPGLQVPSQPAPFPEPESEPIELEEVEPLSSRPTAGRMLSSRPLARQDVDMEAELPIPEVPPSSRRAALPPIAPPLAAPIAPPLAAPIAPPRISRATSPSFAESAPQQPPPPRRIPTAPLSQPGPWLPPGANVTDAVPVTSPTAALPSAPLAAPLAATLPLAVSPRSDIPVGATVGFQSTGLRSAPAPQRTGAPALLIDVTPLSLCVETAGGYADVLVSRNTPVPCERTRDFVTAQDNQQTVTVRVAQGESGTFHENVVLGEVQLTGLSEGPRGNTRIAITFGLDSDGMLHVRALDSATGRNATVEFQLVGAPTSPEVQQMMARHLAKGGPTGLA